MICPDDDGPVCLMECDFDEFRTAQGFCSECEPECDTGCRRGDNCNVCFDEECDVCLGFEPEDECVTCIEGAVKTEGDCECTIGLNYVSDKHECNDICHPACFDCDDINFYDCDECEEGHFFWGGRICRSECPTGTSENPATKACDDIPGSESCFVFDRIAYMWNDLENYGVQLQGGINASVGFEEDDPFPIYRRGVWFDGVNNFFQVTGLVLNHSFTIRTWVKVYNEGYIFSINRNTDTGGNGIDDYFLLGASPTSISFVLNGVFESNETVNSENVSLSDNWHQVVACAEYSGETRSTALHLLVDNVTVNLNTSPVADLIADSSSFTHYVGVDINLTEGTSTFVDFIEGMMYGICFQPRCALDYPVGPPCGDLQCISCPTDGTCLLNCDWNTFLAEDGTCQPCKEECNGCIRAENCAPCFDEGCTNCQFWIGCDLCIDNATNDGEGCECNKGYYYEETLDSCERCDIACAACSTGDIF